MLAQIITTFFLLLDPLVNEYNVEQAVDACFTHTVQPFDPLICLSIAYHESRFRPESVGPKLKSGNYAVGMLQVITKFHKVDPTVDVHTFDGSVIYGQAAFLYWYNRKGSVERALCHYAAGNKCASNYSDKVLTTTYALSFYVLHNHSL